MTGVTFNFDDRDPIYLNIPSVPRVGDVFVYEGTPYMVIALRWFGTTYTWAAEVRCRRRSPHEADS